MATPKDLEQALEIAKAQFQQTDPEVQARRAGAQWLAPEPERHSPKVQIPFMGKRYEILLPEGGVRYQDSDTEPASWEKIILLHYMCRADGSRLTGEYISFREIPEGRIYVSTFEGRAVAPLLGQYGTCPERILGPAASLQGRRTEYGDLSVRIPLFPQVPVVVIFWKPDGEFGPRITILFDRSVTGYLPTEDIVLATQMMALHLVHEGGISAGRSERKRCLRRSR